MFEAKKTLFIYCISPVHMGAGSAVGLIDNPIQRERHTDYPLFAGSGLKGAVRHHFWAQGADGHKLLNRLFGPDSGQNASDHAGAVSFGDAQLVAFPIRSRKRGFVYATSPLALARTKRLLTLSGTETDWPAPHTLGAGRCKVIDSSILDENKLDLETFQLEGEISADLQAIGRWLAEYAVPAGPAYDFFRVKLITDLVLLSDDDFGYFVRNATVVEPHVRIDDVSGTADDGGLFYTENLPPESLLISPIMASIERRKKENGDSERIDDAGKVLDIVLQGNGNGFGGLDGQLVQVGGDATTGRGQVVFTAVKEAGNEQS